ncbi:hypothetical protein TWF281_005901 [Arthrobotrys megalospora]
MGRSPKETIQGAVKSTWDRMAPLRRRKDRLLKDFYSNPSSSNTTPRSSSEVPPDRLESIITVTVPISRAIERMLVPEGTTSENGDMVLRFYVPGDRSVGEVVEEWRRVGDVVVSRGGGGEEKYEYNG